MKRGLKWTIITAACLLICMLAGAACASGAADGPIITFEGVNDDGSFRLDDGIQVWIDATDAAAVYVKDTYNSTFTALHNNYCWGLDDENGWGAHNERIRIERALTEAGTFTVTVRAYWGPMTPTSTPPDPNSLPEGVTCRENSATIQVEPKGTLGTPNVTVRLDDQGRVTRGKLLDVSMNMSTGENNYELIVRKLDGNGQPIVTDTPLVYRHADRNASFFLPTWDLDGNYVLVVNEYRKGYLPGTKSVPFTVVTASDYTAPTGPVWKISDQRVDTEQHFDASIYIPGDQVTTELSILQGGEEVKYAVENGRFASIRGVTLHSDAPVTIRAYVTYANGSGTEYIYNGFSVNQAVDAPTPVISGLGDTHRIGTDLGFTVTVGEGQAAEPIEGRHVTYQVRFSRDADAAVSREGTGSVSLSWSVFERKHPQGNDPGDRVTLYIRAMGRGYNAKEIRKEIILCEEEDPAFRIAFAGTESGHIRLLARERSRVQFQLPGDTSEISYIELYTESTGWESLAYGPDEIPANGISIDPAAGAADNSPVVARYFTMDEGVHYSNTLLIDYYNNGPLPALQVTTNLAMTGGAYHIRRGDFIHASVANPADFAGKGDNTRFTLAVVDRTEAYEQERVSAGGDYSEISTEAGLATWRLEARQEPYYLKMTMSTRDSMWNDSVIEYPLYVDQDAELTGGVRIGATDTQPETMETAYIHAYAAGAQRIELFSGTKSAYESAGSSQNEYTYCSLNSEKACTAHFWARSYYSDNTTQDSEVLEVRVTAPHGDLADALTASIPVQPEAYEDLTVRTVSVNANDPVIPDRLYVTMRPSNGDDALAYTAVHTDEVVIPAWADDETYTIEPGRVYEITVKAYKQGYNPATFTKTVCAADGSAQNTAVLTVNGQNTAALENGTAYTVNITGLPAGVTSVAILEADGSSWTYVSPEAGATSVSRSFTPHTAATQAEIYAVYSATLDGDGGMFSGWDGCTNAVPVTISCGHADSETRVFWDESVCTSIGKKSHTRAGHGEKWTVCSDCGQKLTYMDEVTGVTEAHVFAGGVCAECGYVCPHSAEDVVHTSVLEEGGTATPVDKYLHHVQGTRIEYDRCTNCGEEITAHTGTAVDGNEKHDYDQDYTCTLCGYTSENSYLNIFLADGCQSAVTVQPGGSATLGVRAESDLGNTFTYQWYRFVRDPATGEGTRVPLEGETGASVTLSSITMAAEPFVVVNDGYVSREQWFEVKISNEFSAQASGDADIITESGSTPEMRVNAYCRDGALTYRWYRRVYDGNGNEAMQPVTGIDAPALTAEPVTENEYYECRVEDMYGNRETVAFRLWIDTSLTVTADGDTDVKAAPGSDVTLFVTAEGALADRVTYTWYETVVNAEGWEEDQIVSGADGRSITVRNVTGNRRFYVVATDGIMTQYVYFDVSLDTQLELNIIGDTELTVDYGVPITLRAAATDMYGGSGISYLWYRDYYNPATHEYLYEELGTTPQITATPVRSQVYYCRAWNDSEQTAAGVRITVRSNLSAAIEGPARVDATYNGQLTLTVNATSLTNTFAYTWYSSNPDGTGRTKIEGATGASLVIAAVTETKVYSCDVDDGIEKCTCTGVTVEPDTGLTAVPDGPAAFIAAGEPVTMTVSASSLQGAEAITYRWSRTDAEGSTEEIAGAAGASLTETPAGPMSYRCDVADGFRETFVTFRIFGSEAADCYNGMSRFDVEYGESVTMGVTAASGQAISYQWYHDGAALAGETGSMLTVTATETTDYACAVFFGTDSEPFATLPFEIHINNRILITETEGGAFLLLPAEGLTLSVNATSEHGGELTYRWFRDGSEIQDATGNSLHADCETGNRITRYTCRVSDIYSNSAEIGFACVSGTPEEIQAGTAVSGTGEEKLVRFTPAVTAVYTAALAGGEGSAAVYLPDGSEPEALLGQGTTEVRLKAGQTYYIHLTPGQTLTLAEPQQAEQEAYSFSLQRSDRIEVPALVINGRSYEAASLTSSDASVLYASGKAIRALKAGQATVTVEYEGGIATRTFTISVVSGRLLNLPAGLSEIMAGAFEGDTSLQFVYLPDNVQHVRRGAFANTGTVTFYVESPATGFDDGAFTGAGPVIICDSGSQAAGYCLRNGLLFFYR